MPQIIKESTSEGDSVLSRGAQLSVESLTTQNTVHSQTDVPHSVKCLATAVGVGEDCSCSDSRIRTAPSSVGVILVVSRLQAK